MKAIIIAGIPIALWSINGKDTPEKLRRNFLQILTFQNIESLTGLLNFCVFCILLSVAVLFELHYHD